MLCLVPLLFAPVADAWALDARRNRLSAPPPSARYGWPVRTAMVVVAGAYFFCGLAKLLNSGPAWVTGGNLRWVLYVASDAQGRPNALALFVADRPWLAHAVAAATLALELGFPVVLAVPRLRLPGALAAAGLHAGIYLCMGLNYGVQAAVALLVLPDWSRLFGPRSRLNWPPSPPGALAPLPASSSGESRARA